MRPRYEAVVADWDGRWWSVTIEGVPDDYLCVTQSRKIRDVEGDARAAVVDLLEVDPDSFDLDIRIDPPAVVAAAVAERDEAFAARDDAAAAAYQAQLRAAVVAREAGFTLRDTATLIGLTYGRIGQLLKEADAANTNSRVALAG